MSLETEDGYKSNGSDMKRIAYIVIGLMMVLGCKKPGPDTPVTPPDVPVDPPAKEETLAEKIIGEWHCTVSDIDADIYLALTSDKKFELYQKVGEGSHRLYRGSWSMDNQNILSGRYNDGTSWGSSYATVISEDKNNLTMTPTNAVTQEDHVYRRESIPSAVKDGCITAVKSEDHSEPVL